MADQATTLATNDQKIPRHRSPNYPSMGLRAAVGRAEVLYKAGAMNPLMKVSVLKALGFDKLHGEAGRVLSALKSYGLTEEVGADRMKLSQAAVDIVARQEADPRRLEAIRQSARKPAIYNGLLEEYNGRLPPDASLKSELIAAKHFNPNAVDGFIEDLKDTLDFAGISGQSVLKSEEETDSKGGVTVGCYVQWDSQGILQFNEPKRVREISEDGEWAFIDGSNTGVPVKQLTVVDPPTIVPPPGLPASAQPPPTPRVVVEDKTRSASGIRQDVFSLAEGPVTVQWPSTLSSESFEDLAAWLNILTRKIGRSVDPRRQAQKDRIAKAVRSLNHTAKIAFEDHGQFIWFRVTSSDGSTVLLPYSEDQDAEFYERLSDSELEERIHALSNNRL